MKPLANSVLYMHSMYDYVLRGFSGVRNEYESE